MTAIEMYDEVNNLIAGQNANDVMSMLTAITAYVLFDGIKTGKTIDDAMDLFKLQVQQHMNLMAKGNVRQ